MLFEMLLRGLAVIQLLPPGTVPNDDRHSQEKAVPVVAVASEKIAESAESIQPPTTPPLSAFELKELRKIRNSLPAEFRPLAESQWLGDEAPIFPQHDSATNPPEMEPPNANPHASQQWTSKIRDISERLDKTANQLERQRCYASADELRDLSQQLRLIVRESSVVPAERTDEKAVEKADRSKP